MSTSGWACRRFGVWRGFEVAVVWVESLGAWKVVVVVEEVVVVVAVGMVFSGWGSS
jgi:hypothetical protein